MDDREVVEAIVTGDRTDVAAVYDAYAAGLYGYIHWMLGESTAAAEALKDTLAAILADPPEAAKLRPWLYAVARIECRSRLAVTSQADGEDAGPASEGAEAIPMALGATGRPADTTLQFPAISRLADLPLPADSTIQFPAVTGNADAPPPADSTVQFRAVTLPPDATQPIRAIRQLTSLADRLTGVRGDRRQAELPAQVHAVLSRLEPDEREAIELSFRHDLYDTELATVLGVSWSQAHALMSRTRSRLEADLGPLLVARTGRRDCPMLGTLLADRDGPLTEQTSRQVTEHINQCQTCAGRRRAALRPAVLSSLSPLAVLPRGMRDTVLDHSPPAPEPTRDAQRSASAARWARWSAAIKALSWDSIRSHPGATAAATAVVLWVAAAVSVAVLTLTDSHPAHALVTRPSVSAHPSSPVLQITSAAAGRTSPAARHRPAVRPSEAVSQHYLAPSPGPITTAAGTVSSKSSASSSPKPSKSASPSRSASRSKSASPSASPSASASRSASPSPSVSA